MTTTAPTAPAAPATEQPLLAGKFKTPAELEAGYKALEAKLGQPKPPAAPEAPSSLAIDPAKPAPPPSTIDDVLARAGLEPATVAAAWNKDGKLGDEHYEALEKIGFPKGIVDAAVAGLASQAKAATKTRQEAIAGAIQIAGGEQQLRNMMEWAKTNFSPDDIAHFNAQVDGKGATPASIKAGIELLVGRYRSQFGGSPAMNAPNGAPSGTPGTFAASPAAAYPFTSHQEQADAVSDIRFQPHDARGNSNPKYDPAYVEQVINRIRATKKAGGLVRHPMSARG